MTPAFGLQPVSTTSTTATSGILEPLPALPPQACSLTARELSDDLSRTALDQASLSGLLHSLTDEADAGCQGTTATAYQWHHWNEQESTCCLDTTPAPHSNCDGVASDRDRHLMQSSDCSRGRKPLYHFTARCSRDDPESSNRVSEQTQACYGGSSFGSNGSSMLTDSPSFSIAMTSTSTMGCIRAAGVVLTPVSMDEGLQMLPDAADVAACTLSPGQRGPPGYHLLSSRQPKGSMLLQPEPQEDEGLAGGSATAEGNCAQLAASPDAQGSCRAASYSGSLASSLKDLFHSLRSPKRPAAQSLDSTGEHPIAADPTVSSSSAGADRGRAAASCRQIGLPKGSVSEARAGTAWAASVVPSRADEIMSDSWVQDLVGSSATEPCSQAVPVSGGVRAAEHTADETSRSGFGAMMLRSKSLQRPASLGVREGGTAVHCSMLGL